MRCEKSWRRWRARGISSRLRSQAEPRCSPWCWRKQVRFDFVQDGLSPSAAVRNDIAFMCAGINRHECRG
jgi:hypothetical protein